MVFSISTEIDEEELVIGRWGRADGSQLRCQFMQDCYPKEAVKLQKSERWEQLALDVEREAMDFWQLLRMQYAKANPRPMDDFMEIVKWVGNRKRFPNTRDFYVEGFTT